MMTNTLLSEFYFMKRMLSNNRPGIRSFLPLTAIALVSLTGFHLQAAEIQEDFESDPAVIVEAKSHEETRNEIVEDPAKPGNRVMKFSWVAHGGTHVAGSLSAPGPILVDGPGVYEITAKVNFEQCGPEITKMALRIVDANNETFQLSAPVDKAGEPGWSEVRWVLNTNDPETDGIASWGERVDHVIDFPAKFYGFAVDLKDWKTEGGQLLFDDISVTKISD